MLTQAHIQELRQQFPALHKTHNGRSVIYLDGPGGTQVPQMVIDAISSYLSSDNSNLGGAFLNSRETGKHVDAARAAMADFLNAASPDEIIFGHNMTTLTFQMSRALSRTWEPGDEIILTKIDHNANIDPWLQAAADRAVTVRWVEVDPTTCTLDLDSLQAVLSEKTRLVAATYASNAVGSITDVKQLVEVAHAAGALTYIDAVHYAPHGLIDVQDLDTDFLVCSPYKFYGPHMGTLYGKYAHLAELQAYKVRPASNEPPEKWETGTNSFESMVGVTAAIDYLADLAMLLDPQSASTSRRDQIVRAMHAIRTYEAKLSKRFLTGCGEIDGLTLVGLQDLDRIPERTPTFGARLANQTPQELGNKLANEGIFAWVGHFYALTLMEDLGLLPSGGVVRVGFVHYTTEAEVDRLLAFLQRQART